MSKGINYGKLMHKAYCQFISDVLAQVAREGLPGKHHFLITFDTTHPGVDMSQSLRDRYPAQMMIVMQDWFTDLAVMHDRFTVTLNFGNVPEPIVVPFAAIDTFIDPSIEWGLTFQEYKEAEGVQQTRSKAPAPAPIKPAPKGEVNEPSPEGAVINFESFRKKN
jgi:uncharacterized protein